LKDPDLISEAKKSRIEIEPSTGEEVEVLVNEIMNQPPEVIQRLKKLFGS
jgi:hypothetical protein